ncbi:hypothetical protein GCM10022393_35870 [Aquimarina addita]|uniref:HTH luxR-type domain-containing protein n=1 Tax=Aquimarina addita TaxID=870485 RepID=A0ABP6UQV9_9FLAO
MILFLKILNNLFAFFLCFIFSASAQKIEDSIAREKLYKDFQVCLNTYGAEGYANHHRMLKKALELSYLEVELGCYTALSKDHVFGLNEQNFDSVIYYFDRFESRVATLDSTVLKKENISNRMAVYYDNKGYLLGDMFGLHELELESYLKAEPYLNKNDVRYQTYHDFYLTFWYNEKGKYDTSLKLLSNRLKDTLNMVDLTKIHLFQRIGNVYRKKNMPEQSIFYDSKAMVLIKKMNDADDIRDHKINMAYNYFLLGDTQKAIDSILVLREVLKTAEQGRLKGLANTAEYLSQFYYSLGDINKTMFYAQKIVDDNSNSNKVIRSLELLAKCAMKKKEYQSAIDFYKKRDRVVDSIHSLEKDLVLKYSAANMKLMRQKQINQNIVQENQLLEENNEKQKLYFAIIGCFLISLLLLFAGIFAYKKYKQSKKEVFALKANEKELLQEQIRLRDNELDATAIALSQRVEVLNVIKGELDTIKDNNPKLVAVNRTINDLIQSSSDIALITEKIESQYPALTINLKSKHPELSDTEIRYCLLTKLKLSVKETATILNVAPDTVKTSRSRLKKKMNIPPEISLKEYLDKIHVQTT